MSVVFPLPSIHFPEATELSRKVYFRWNNTLPPGTTSQSQSLELNIWRERLYRQKIARAVKLAVGGYK